MTSNEQQYDELFSDKVLDLVSSLCLAQMPFHLRAILTTAGYAIGPGCLCDLEDRDIEAMEKHVQSDGYKLPDGCVESHYLGQHFTRETKQNFRFTLGEIRFLKKLGEPIRSRSKAWWANKLNMPANARPPLRGVMAQDPRRAVQAENENQTRESLQNQPENSPISEESANALRTNIRKRFLEQYCVPGVRAELNEMEITIQGSQSTLDVHGKCPKCSKNLQIRMNGRIPNIGNFTRHFDGHFKNQDSPRNKVRRTGTAAPREDSTESPSREEAQDNDGQGTDDENDVSTSEDPHEDSHLETQRQNGPTLLQANNLSHNTLSTPLHERIISYAPLTPVASPLASPLAPSNVQQSATNTTDGAELLPQTQFSTFSLTTLTNNESNQCQNMDQSS